MMPKPYTPGVLITARHSALAEHPRPGTRLRDSQPSVRNDKWICNETAITKRPHYHPATLGGSHIWRYAAFAILS